MVRYFYSWIPLGVVVGAAVILTIPYLALVVLLAVAVAVAVAVAALIWATVSALYTLARSTLSHAAPTASSDRADRSPRVALHAGGVGGGGAR